MTFRGKPLVTVLSLAFGAVLSGVAAYGALAAGNRLGAAFWLLIAGVFVVFLLRRRPARETGASRTYAVCVTTAIIMCGSLGLVAGIEDSRPERVLALLGGGVMLVCGLVIAYLLWRQWKTPLFNGRAYPEKEATEER